MARVEGSAELIGDMLGTQFYQAARDLRHKELAGQFQFRPSEEEEARKHIVEYPIWGVIKLLEQASGLPDGEVKEKASSAARSAGRGWAAENMPDPQAQTSSFAFYENFSSSMTVQKMIKSLADVCISAFTKSLSEDSPASGRVFRGGLDEPYCSQECFDRGGATITRTMLQGWTGDCSVCRRPLELGRGLPGSLVCDELGRLLYFHQEQACVDAVRAEVSRKTACVVCGTAVNTD